MTIPGFDFQAWNRARKGRCSDRVNGPWRITVLANSDASFDRGADAPIVL